MKITLCGSTRFESEFRRWDERLTLAGHVVYNLSIYPRDKGGQKDYCDANTKMLLDLIHLAKIEESDAIVVLNVNGYYGESTAREIAWAIIRRKVVYWLYPVQGDEFPAESLVQRDVWLNLVRRPGQPQSG